MIETSEPAARDSQMFQKIERPRLPQIVAEQLEEAILSGVIGPGNRLPSEQALADQFGVSRNIVREGFKILQARGLIQIVSGSGAFVAYPDSQATSDALGRYIRLSGTLNSRDSIRQLYEVRRILEGENARLAAQRANEHDLAALTECLERMQLHQESVERWTDADLDFHLGLAKATHNPFLSLLLEPLVSQLISVITGGFLVPGGVDTGLEAHRRLHECVLKRDAAGAYTALMEHLNDSEARAMDTLDARAQKGSG